MCPSQFRNQYIGKEGYPTVAYKCVVSHNNRVLHVAGGLPGAFKNKKICRYDQLVCDLRDKKYLDDLELTTTRSDGSASTP